MNKTDSGVAVLAREAVFEGYFRVDRWRLRFRRYDGTMSAPMTREVFERGHAAAVLPYDPARDAVALIEQFRIGVHAAGRAPWVTEIVAGVIEPGEDTEAVVRREAIEEAGLVIGRIQPIFEVYASPGGTSETVMLFVGEADLRDAGGIHGLQEEGEDIRAFVVPASEAIAMAARGDLHVGPTIIALLWLDRNRARLRRAWLEERPA